MKENKSKRWRCEICFEEFEGEEPPVPCPVCGASRDQFIEITPKGSHNLLEDFSQNILIIGNGVSGYYAAKTIRDKSINANITIVSSEEYLSYYRPQVSSYLSMDKIENNMFISPADWYVGNNINLILGETVTKLDVENKSATLTDGRNLSYDKLILANGSRCSILPVKGIEKTNVFTLRDIKDADNIKASMKNAKNAVVIGGGLLGLEAAWELKQCGLNVTVVEFMATLLPRQLDESGAKIFKNYVNECGVTIMLGESAEEILGDGKVEGLKLKSGKTLEADLVLFSVGIKPNVEIVDSTSINKNRGILVNDKMETNIEGVYACGDVAEINGRVYGNWPASIEMGKVAGANILGEKAVFEDFVSSTIFDGMGVKMFSCGDINSSFEALESKKSENSIEKLFFKDGVIVGGYIIGDTSSAQNIVKAIQDKATFETVKKNLLK